MISETRAKLYCKEDISLIENYDIAVNDKNRKWVVHHRGEILPCGRYGRIVLKKFGLYYHRPACELIFMTRTEHIKLHTIGNMYCLGKHHSDQTKEKMSTPVLQYSKDGEFIREWFGVREAGRTLNINPGHISSCCKGTRKSSGGFVWRYD